MPTITSQQIWDTGLVCRHDEKVVNAHNFVELAVNNGSAKDRFAFKIGDPVLLSGRLATNRRM
jgi:hypothetical protein